MEQNSFIPVKDGKFAASRPVLMLMMAAIAIITSLFLYPCLNNKFTNWDDPSYIIQNDLVKSLSASGLKHIFTTPSMGNYHPITILLYAIEYHFAQLEPGLYHVDSLLLHIIVTLLVFWFVNLLTRRPIAALVTALLFGLHPMHVEPVAWVSGRKDLLYTFFYLLSCIAYIKFIRAKDGRRHRWYWACMGLFVCSLLSKPVAVTLPLVLLLIDFFENGRITKKDITSKIVHLFLALCFGIAAYIIQSHSGALNVASANFGFFDRIALAGYALFIYLEKLIWPAKLCNFYTYPARVNGSLPLWYFLYPIVIIALILVVYKFFRKNRVVVFGGLFFLVNILLLLQLIPVGEAIMAERYTYLSYIGLFFIAGWLVSMVFEEEKSGAIRIAVGGLSIIIIGGLGFMSKNRCKIWYDSVTLWRDNLEQVPVGSQVAIDNLGAIYFDKWYNAKDKQERHNYYDSAYYLLRISSEMWPDVVTPYQGLGMLYYSKKDYQSASKCFQKALQINPTSEGYSNFGNFLEYLGKTDTAVMQYSKAIELNPTGAYSAFINRGKIYKRNNHWAAAMKDFGDAIKINPTSGEPYYERSFCDTAIGLVPNAIQDIETALTKGYTRIDSNYYSLLKGKER